MLVTEILYLSIFHSRLWQADFWVSQQRHWCKYCKKFIANNKPSIQLHESGRSHKAQVEKFLRDVYKRGKEEKEEKYNLQRELQRIERAAMKTYSSRDVPGYRPSASSSPAPAASSSSVTTTTSASQQPYCYWTPSPAPATTSSPYTPTPPPPPPPSSVSSATEDQQQVQTPSTHLQGRDEWALPTPVAAPGEWQTVTPIKKPEESTENKPETQKKTTTHNDKLEFQDDEEENEEDLKSFKIREKEFPTDAIGDHDEDDSSKAGEDAGGSLFKKRKISQQSSSRKKKPLRKKTED
ncbi:hypothetical protein VTP01DRAFT_9571 [Rhizomucor pusillus]|uniref:uncharacterized protein n=1 Tax=Rhizomucor pusillus TaxID=4840 RepID=UPI0037447550